MNGNTVHKRARTAAELHVAVLGVAVMALVVIGGCVDSVPRGGTGQRPVASDGQESVASEQGEETAGAASVDDGSDVAVVNERPEAAHVAEGATPTVAVEDTKSASDGDSGTPAGDDEGADTGSDGESPIVRSDDEGSGQIGNGLETNLVWYEATAGASGTVDAQGSGQALVLGCESIGNPVVCDWTVQMILESNQPLTGWAQDLTGDIADAAVLEVQSFDYHLDQFTVPAGGELFGPPPDLLVNTGASSPAPDGVPPSQYTLLEFVLAFNFDGSGTTTRPIVTDVGDSGWSDPTGVPLTVQFGDNDPAVVDPGLVLPNPVIIINPAIATEVCDDGEDNDGDGLVDCADPDCIEDPHCDPVLTCPEDLVVECDGAGNSAQLDEWRQSVTVDSVCENLSLTDDFLELSDDCGMTGSAMVTWTATDDCGTDTCSATFMIADETAPTVTGPEDSTVECDGGGNQADLDRWLAGAGADDTCGAASLSSDFAGLSDDCGATGSATVTWTATDDCANTGTHTAAFSIEDTTAPTITLNGPAEMTLECHVDVYAEPGAVAADSCDTSLVSAQVRGDTVDVNTPGTYLVTYDAVDGCGNEAEQVTRTVEVVDTLPPAVTNGEMIEIWPPNH
ncbi:MAG: immunoglobulin-like domain-containing protein, partial [Planctomycetota bacterium]